MDETTLPITPIIDTKNQCSCGGTIVGIDGLTGSFCAKCGKHYDRAAPVKNEPKITTPDVETIKAYRGVQCHEIIYGTEGRGKIKIEIPFFYSEQQSKEVIDQQIRLLKYTKEKCKLEGLDIESKR